MQKIQLCITGINNILKYIQIENSYFILKNRNLQNHSLLCLDQI